MFKNIVDCNNDFDFWSVGGLFGHNEPVSCN